jgi:hypothetical protein
MDLFKQIHLQNEKLHDLYLPPDTIRVTKSEIMIWAGQVVFVR